jgi:hypothetical protein
MRGATTEASSRELVETVRQQVGGEGERNILLYMYQRVADNEADNVAEARRWLTGRGGRRRPGVQQQKRWRERQDGDSCWPAATKTAAGEVEWRSRGTTAVAKGRTTEWRQRGQVAARTGERNAKKAAGIATRADGVWQWQEGMQAEGEGWKTHVYITV